MPVQGSELKSAIPNFAQELGNKVINNDELAVSIQSAEALDVNDADLWFYFHSLIYTDA